MRDSATAAAAHDEHLHRAVLRHRKRAVIGERVDHVTVCARHHSAGSLQAPAFFRLNGNITDNDDAAAAIATAPQRSACLIVAATAAATAACVGKAIAARRASRDARIIVSAVAAVTVPANARVNAARRHHAAAATAAIERFRSADQGVESVAAHASATGGTDASGRAGTGSAASVFDDAVAAIVSLTARSSCVAGALPACAATAVAAIAAGFIVAAASPTAFRDKVDVRGKIDERGIAAIASGLLGTASNATCTDRHRIGTRLDRKAVIIDDAASRAATAAVKTASAATAATNDENLKRSALRHFKRSAFGERMHPVVAYARHNAA